MKPNEGFIDFDPEQEVPRVLKPETRKTNIFLEQAKRANQEIGDLERELRTLTQRIGAIKELMAAGKYPGKLSDLAELAAKKDAITKQINEHQDKQSDYNRLSGRREETVFKRRN